MIKCCCFTTNQTPFKLTFTIVRYDPWCDIYCFKIWPIMQYLLFWNDPWCDIYYWPMMWYLLFWDMTQNAIFTVLKYPWSHDVTFTIVRYDPWCYINYHKIMIITHDVTFTIVSHDPWCYINYHKIIIMTHNLVFTILIYVISTVVRYDPWSDINCCKMWPMMC